MIHRMTESKHRLSEEQVGAEVGEAKEAKNISYF